MNLIYGVKDRPKAGQLILFALQQLLAILAATIAVPMQVNATTGSDMSISAALFGAGAGTLIYLLFTKFRSPVFLGSSFAFIGSMCAAFAGGVSMAMGYLGLLIGAVFAGLVYVIIAVVVKLVGVKWIDKVMPAAVIGPTVALIGLSLAGSAIQNSLGGIAIGDAGSYVMDLNSILCLICALFTLAVTIVCSVYGKKMMKMIPFIIGILSGYALAAIFTAFSYIPGAEAMRIIDFTIFQTMDWVPAFTFVEIFTEGALTAEGGVGAYIGTIAVAYIPVAFVVFAEHIADHKNISSIIEKDLLTDPGLSRTLLGDGVGSMVGAFFGGCPNTTYGESIGCVAISGNASVVTILLTAALAMVSAFIAPFVTFLSSIPGCWFYRRQRSENGAEGRPQRQCQPVHRFLDPGCGRRQPGSYLRADHDHQYRLRAHPRHPCQRTGQYPLEKEGSGAGRNPRRNPRRRICRRVEGDGKTAGTLRGGHSYGRRAGNVQAPRGRERAGRRGIFRHRSARE